MIFFMVKLNITINDIVRREIDNILSEELSISDEVKSTTEDIFNEIFTFGNYRFQYVLFELGEFSIICEPVAIRKLGVEPSSALDVKNGELRVRVPKYNGQIDPRALKASIMHEVEHAFQISKTKANKGASFDDVYDKAVEVLSSKESSKEEIFFATFLYCCSTKEQDAFVNELYVHLMEAEDCDKRKEADIFRTSQAYRALTIISNALEEFSDIKDFDFYTTEVEYYNKNLRWFVNIGRNAKRRLTSKIRNVLKKARKDKLISGA